MTLYIPMGHANTGKPLHIAEPAIPTHPWAPRALLHSLYSLHTPTHPCRLTGNRQLMAAGSLRSKLKARACRPTFCLFISHENRRSASQAANMTPPPAEQGHICVLHVDVCLPSVHSAAFVSGPSENSSFWGFMVNTVWKLRPWDPGATQL